MTTLAQKMRLKNKWGAPTLFWEILTFAGIMAAIIGAILAIVFCAVVYGGRAYGRATCRNWGRQTAIQTKFVILNWADSGTCLAKTRDGRWVKNTQVFINVPERSK